MSIFSGIVNPNTPILTETRSASALAGATDIYITISNWPSYAYLTDVVIKKPADIIFATPLNISIHSDGAAHRASGDLPSGVSESFVNNMIAVALTDTYIVDEKRAECLYIRLNSGSATFPTGFYVDVSVEGYKAIPFNKSDTETTPITDTHGINTSNTTAWHGIETFRVLRKDSSNNVYVLTKNSLQNTNPYEIPTSFVVFNNASDELYIGRDVIFKTVAFGLDENTRQPSATTFEVSYYGTETPGSSGDWVAISRDTPEKVKLFNNTCSGQFTVSASATNTTIPADSYLDNDMFFEYAGTIDFSNIPSINLMKTSLDFDPDYIYYLEVMQGRAPAVSMYNYDRYWIKIKPSSGAVFPIKFYFIHPLIT